MNEKLLDLKDVYDGVKTERINKLRKEFKESGLLKEIEELPVYSIIVKKPKKNLTEDLKLLLETFHSTGKVIEVERGKLDDGIKTSVKKYAEFSSKFRAGMTGKFRKIVGVPKAFNKSWIVYSGISIGVLAIGGFCWFSQTKTDKTKGKI